MKKAPYSLTEAEALCKEYQFLAGQPFAKDTDEIIEFITVAPFDEENKNRFIICFLLFNDPETALACDYRGLLFDVLVVGRSENKDGLVHENLHTWLSRQPNLVPEPMKR